MSDASQWRENLKLLRDLGRGFHDGSADDQNLITIVDEAHALINPQTPAVADNLALQRRSARRRTTSFAHRS